MMPQREKAGKLGSSEARKREQDCYERLLLVLRDLQVGSDWRDFDVVAAAGSCLVRIAIEVGQENEHFANEGPIVTLAKRIEARQERDRQGED